MPPRRQPPSAASGLDAATCFHSHVLAWDYGALADAAAKKAGGGGGANAAPVLGRVLPPLPATFASVKVCVCKRGL
jgi:hypothetical protein